MAENFPNLVETINLYILEAQQISSNISSKKSILRNNIIKTKERKRKRKNIIKLLKEKRQNYLISNKGNLSYTREPQREKKLTADVSLEPTEARKQWDGIFKTLK